MVKDSSLRPIPSWAGAGGALRLICIPSLDTSFRGLLMDGGAGEWGILR